MTGAQSWPARAGSAGDPDETVRTELQEDRRQQHRADGRGRGVSVGQPGVQRPHRHLYGEPEEQRRKHPRANAPVNARHRRFGSATMSKVRTALLK